LGRLLLEETFDAKFGADLPASERAPQGTRIGCPGFNEARGDHRTRSNIMSNTSNRGFASMDEDKQREIASKGGRASGGNFAHDRGRASEAGKKGGQASGGNFANDPQRASEAGRKGGEASHGGRK
jgi:uncharacterized protein